MVTFAGSGPEIVPRKSLPYRCLSGLNHDHHLAPDHRTTIYFTQTLIARVLDWNECPISISDLDIPFNS
ncbi:hypothetical protein AG1IA_08743 [Rhizoctonia solani AG-1 IA]|uniref:Uncharacterized protein n=1 Tax=Thanatephorus cucumeris (strain AG1-IA) TaxID=983506 RepID=L8WK89_THACA|nr:hypothetical protein AG1IA_08743 [Rhizoctonia solani AG-1 IA]